MQKRWTLCCIVLLLMGHFSIQRCEEAQKPTTDTNHVKEPASSDEEDDDSILSHIHFSDNTEEDLNETEKEDGSSRVKTHTQGINQAQCYRDNVHFFLDIVLGRLDNCTSLYDLDHQQQRETPPAKQEYQRPVCKKGEGCDIPLNCYDFVTNGPRDIVPDPPRVVELTPLQLQNLLGNGTYKNCCALVMFYAPWCEYSVNFAQTFNAIGRTFLNLPVIAVDLSAHDPHKFVLAYLPVIAFYHWGKVIYKFNLEDSYEEMTEQLVKMTEFMASPVNISEEENSHPVPIEREKADRFYLRLAVGWLIFVVAVTILKSRPVVELATRLRSRLQGPPPVVAGDHDNDE